METTRARALVAVVFAAVAAGVVVDLPRRGSRDVAAVDAGVFAGGKAWLDGQKLDLNTADAASLARISGIGPALAQKIVDERARRGRFEGVDDLDDVPGIGPKLLAKLSGFVEVR